MYRSLVLFAFIINRGNSFQHFHFTTGCKNHWRGVRLTSDVLEGVIYALPPSADDEECSIDNLDACLDDNSSTSNSIDGTQEIIDGEDDTCSIDNLDACVAQLEECDEDNIDACATVAEIDDEVKLRLSQSLSLRRFFANPLVEVQLAVLVLLSSLIVGLGTLQSLPPEISNAAAVGELLVSAVFTVEYVLRWKLEDFSLQYFLTPAALIDLIAIIPGIVKIATALELSFGLSVPALGGALINLRLLRILRLQRVLKDYDTFKKFEMALGLDPSNTRPWQLQLARVVISIFTLLSVTAGLIYSAEHKVNPYITDYFTSLYFSLTTLTTVGFGDLVPMTVAGRWVIGGSILIASVVVPAQAAALVEALINREGEKEDELSLKQKSKSSLNNEVIITADYIALRLEKIEEQVSETNKRIDRLVSIILDQKQMSKKDDDEDEE